MFVEDVMKVVDNELHAKNPAAVNAIRAKLSFVIRVILSVALKESFTQYKENLRDCSEWVDQYMLGYIEKVFQVNMYFIDSTTRMPYRTGTVPAALSRNILILWINEEGEGSHYEAISQEDVYEFRHDNPLIVKVRDHLLVQ